MYVVSVDIDLCEACGDCIDACPSELMALVEEDGKKYAMFKGDPDDCIACYSCESTCDQGAVAVTEV